MKERPIIFSAPMVNAIIQGRKTQTRRIAKKTNRPCPFGTPGDRLWVRERYTPCEVTGIVRYAADALPETVTNRPRWMSSIHMPRLASRLVLLINNVRIEQLHNMTEADARAEGLCCPPQWNTPPNPTAHDTASSAFRDLWCRLHGEWLPNTWVWVIQFERIELRTHVCLNTDKNDSVMEVA
ncbi:hypothetical protein XFUD_02010 [Xylella fastidiosa]|uniref:Phage-related protein n=1 Tax=Xylella fastidiosa (strain 9a5c) TaxID=160492 RepID=Q9PG17_XYLFA|nr:hypothetical protein [Xylella fastidiosa]AAF83295.1 phage-related protein [Xylella fastidiosa 9a5c]ALQ94127.1 hypothetical protein XFUD_02010 [Xylella fastidiosa]NRP55004.1 hypothetical protein [Xylella fastidiosa]OCA58641.1 hypothetical protein AA93_02010 [Xylella fastidiosa subsp. pauca 11399]